MSERTETSKLVVKIDRGEEIFFFRAVDGKVLLGCNVRTYVAGRVNLKEVAPVALTRKETVKFIRRLLDVLGEACEQKEKKKL